MNPLRERLNDLKAYIHQIHGYLSERILEEDLTQEEIQRALKEAFLEIQKEIDHIIIENFPLH